MPTFDPNQPFEEVAVADAPKFQPEQPFEPMNEGEQWKPLYSGLDQAPMNPEHAQALDYLGRKLGDDKETRAATINQSYVQSKMPNWALNVMQQNWPTIRDQYAKESGFTQGEPITDSGLYSKIATDIAEEPQRNKIIAEISPYSQNSSDRLHYQSMTLPQLTTWQEINAPNTFAELGAKKLELGSLPDIPGLGLGNPALAAAAWNTITRTLPGLTSPLAIATGGVAAEAKAGSEVAKKALVGITGLFAGLMGKAAVDKAPEVVKVVKDPKAGTQEKGEAVGEFLTDTIFSLLAAFHTVSAFSPKSLPKVEGKTPQESAQILRQEANATAEAEPREALLNAAEKLDEIPAPKPVEEVKATETPITEETTATAQETATVGPQEVEKAFSAKNKAVDAALKEMGEEPATRGDKRTFEEALNDAKEKMSADPGAGTKLVDELRDNPRPVTGNEDALLHMEVTRLALEREAGRRALEAAQKLGDKAAIADAQDRIAKAQQDYVNTTNVTAQVGTQNAHGLAFRAMMLKEDYSLANMERQRAEATGKPLTPEQTKEIQDLHDQIQKTQKAFDEYKAQETQRHLAREEADRPHRGKPPSKLAAKLTEQADAARKRIKDRLTSGRVSAGLDPADLADHAIVGADYLAKGIRNFSAWSEAMLKEFGERVLPHLKEIYDQAIRKNGDEKRLQSFKSRTAKSTEQLKEKTEQSDFSTKTRSPLRLDEEGLKLKAEHERAKQEFQKALLKDKLAKEGAAGKAASTLVKWRRGFLLSSPVTLAKLTAAAALRMVSTPLEEVVGAGLGKIPGISTIAENAPREGGLNLSAEGHAIVDAVTKGMSDAVNIFKTGKSNLEAAISKQAGEVHLSDIAPRSVIDLFGQIHSALKAPVKRSEFARSFEKRMAFAEAHGVDITDPLVQTRITTEAYKDANRAIFMQDNMVTDAYKRALSRFEQIDKTTGKPASIAASTALRVALPIVKVPTNIVSETATYATGTLTGTARTIHAALTKGLENLTPEQSDLILRQLKKGLIGNALLAFGYFNSTQVGGYYQQGEKRKKDDVAAGAARVGETDLPSYILHNPAMEQLQIGATIHRVADSKLNKHDREAQGLGSGAWAAGFGLVEEVPFAREAVEFSKLMDPHEKTYAEGELLKSIFIPAVVQWTATQLDRDSSGEKIKRHPQTVREHIEAGIPGLRQDVPKKK